MKRTIFFIMVIALIPGCQKEEITFSSAAHDVFYLENDKASMPIRVHGNTASKTFLMMIHGGPGGDAIVYRSDFVKKHVEPEFAMVYWDQRNGGASQGGVNGGNDKLEQFIEDFEKVVALLKYRYGDDISIFVNGHSWGGFLAPAFLQRGNNQQNVKGWIQSAGAHNIPLLNQYAVEMLLDKASVEIAAGRNVSQWTEITNYCDDLTPPFTEEQGRKINEFAGLAHTLIPELSQQGLVSFGEVFSIYQENNFPVSQMFVTYNPLHSALAMWLFQGQQLSDGMPAIDVPTLLLFGKWDFICPPKLADDIEQRVSSAYVKKVIFENSGHGLMSTADKEAYWQEVIAFVNEFK